MTVFRRRFATLAATAAILALAAATGFAQRIWYGGYGYTPPRSAQLSKDLLERLRTTPGVTSGAPHAVPRFISA